MNNKLLFISITLALTLIIGYFFHHQQITRFQQKISAINTEHNAKITTLPFSSNDDLSGVDDSNNVNISIIEDLNNQLISARSALKIVQQKLLLASSKSTVLSDEIAQIKDARGKVKSLKTSLKKSKQKIKVLEQKLKHIQSVFKLQNKSTVVNNIERIQTLQKTSTGIGISGLLVPVVGVAILTAYTIKEIKNYCANIKSIISLEEKIFKEVISLNAQMQKKYHQQCIVGIFDAQQPSP